MCLATDGAGRSTDHQSSDALPLRSLMLVAAAGYGLIEAVMVGVFPMHSLLAPTLSG